MKIGIVTVGYALPIAMGNLFYSVLNGTENEFEYHLFLHSDQKDILQVADQLARFQEVRLYPYACNRGLSRSWNEGILNAYHLNPGKSPAHEPGKFSPCDVVIVVNDDCQFQIGDVDKLARYAIEHRELYMVGAWGKNQRSGQEESLEWSCFAINPSALDKVGFFDENIFPIYYEDCDYAYRGQLLGMQKGVCRETMVLHGGSSTLNDSDANQKTHSQTFLGNQNYYKAKWGGLPGSERYKTPFDMAYGLRIEEGLRHRPFMPEQNRFNPSVEGHRLDIGCGVEKLKGYLGVDPYVPSDYQAVMWDLPFDVGSVIEIYSSHALEHVKKAMVIPTLKEWARVLASEGRITLRVPDLEWCVRNWLKTKGDGWDMATIFGHQAHDGEVHQTGFTKELMEGYIKEAGLYLVKYEELETHGQKTMSFELCRK